ncbi:carbohydrate porin [Geothrix terrae]|uniref:carbohydrate porin n=1 Tax=Geothrix terrae TaxID=2922720 RepID=UPI001FAC1E07
MRIQARTFLLGLALPAALAAQSAMPRLLGLQATFIGQELRPFASPYAGPNSLTGDGDRAVTQTYGAYVGSQLTERFQLYLDVELFRGSGVGRTVGLAGLPNGDAIRAGSADLGQAPYLARLFGRWTLPLGGGGEAVERGMDQLPGRVPVQRLVVTFGKLAANDLFDTSAFAGAPRTQFMNWSLFNAPAWDFPADTRGYTRGVAAELRLAGWALALGRFQMPTEANGNVLDGDLARAHSDNLQLTLMPEGGPVIRLLGYVNHARMGDYAAALAQGGTPDITATRAPDRAKRGWVLNLEQPLAPDGASGLFLRAGWNDGHTESFAFTEADRSLSFGGQGRGWGAEDRWGLALSIQDLSREHRAYLAAGGSGFVLGDGRLSPARERVAEVYYAWAPRPWLRLSPDLQMIHNPGYNRDRGPAWVFGLRLRLSV